MGPRRSPYKNGGPGMPKPKQRKKDNNFLVAHSSQQLCVSFLQPFGRGAMRECFRTWVEPADWHLYPPYHLLHREITKSVTEVQIPQIPSFSPLRAFKLYGKEILRESMPNDFYLGFAFHGYKEYVWLFFCSVISCDIGHKTWEHVPGMRSYSMGWV